MERLNFQGPFGTSWRAPTLVRGMDNIYGHYCSKVKLIPFSLSQKPGAHPQQTTLLDLMDALPSSGPVAQKAEPWGPSASANQTNPWGGQTAPASTSDHWPSFGKDPPSFVSHACLLNG